MSQYFEQRGDPTAPTVLLVDGLGGVAEELRGQAERLSRGHHAILVDQRGTGRSSRTDAGHTTQQLAADMAALISHLDTGPVHFVGASTGAAIGQYLVLDHPETVRTLTMAGAFARFDAYAQRGFAVRRAVVADLDRRTQDSLMCMVIHMTTTASLKQPVEGLWATPASPLPFDPSVSIRAFLLERTEGNVIVYNAPGLGTAAAEIRERGGASKLLINHGHEGMFGVPPIDAPVFVHERDRAALGGAIAVAGTFSGREMIAADLEVIPIPGHTPGGAAYLWDSGAHRFLFTGDSVWLDHGVWSAVILDTGARQDYLDSLALLRQLDFDVLVPWGATQDEPCADVVSRSEARERLGAIIERLEAGGDR